MIPVKPLKITLVNVSDKKGVIDLLSSRQEESNRLHGGKDNPVEKKGSEIFDKMIASPHVLMLVARLDDQIVGILTIYLLERIRSGGKYAVIEDVVITKSLRRLKIGTCMLEQAIKECRSRDVISVKLGTRKDETGILRFYEHLGFEYLEKLMSKRLKP